MNKYIIFFSLLLGTYYSSQVTTVYTKFNFPQNKCDRPASITMLFYKNKDSIKILSKKCSDTIIINQPLQGIYYLDIHSDSYSSLKNEVIFDKSNKLLIEKFIDKTQEKTIKEVVITKVTDPIVQTKGNKTTFSVANNDALNNGTLLEAILKLPGVFSGFGNGITVNGKVTTIYIDGLPTNFSGQDLTNYLNSISTASIQKIELIGNPGAMYDANSSSSIINIITNKKNKKGIGGILLGNTNFYIKQKYQSALVLNGLFNKLSWNFNVNYSDLGYENSNRIKVFNTSNNESLNNYIFNDGINKPLVLEGSLSYPIKENTTASFKYRFANSTENINSNTSLDLITPSNTIGINGLGEQYLKNHKNDILFKVNHRFKNEKNNVSLTYNGLFFNKDLVTKTINSFSNQSDINNNYFNDFKLASNKLMLDFEFLTKYIKINFGGKGAISRINSKGMYYENLINNKILDFRYDEKSNALYIELNKEINKFNITGGLRYESVDFKSFINDINANKKTINKFFPSVSFGYTISPMADLNLSYSKKIKFPGYQELDPNNSGITNSYLSDQGNPYLTPSISDNYEFRSNFLKMGFLSLTYSKTDVDNFAIAKYDNGTYIQAIEPFHNIKNWGAAFGMPFPLGIITKGFAYSSTITDINKINYLYLYSGINFPKYNESIERSNKGLYYIGVNSNFILPFSTKMNLNYQYVSSGNYMIYTLDKPYYKFDLTFTKSMLDNNLRIAFSLQDIFKTATGINGSFRNNNLDLFLKTYSDTQRIRLSVTYLFGNNKINKPKIDTNSDDRENKKSSLDFKQP